MRELKRGTVLGESFNCFDLSELEAIIFLHSNYCHIEPTKTTIDNYYTSRTHIPHFFDKRDILSDEMQMANDVFVVTVLPKQTKEGHKVVLARLMDTDPSKFTLNSLLKL